MSIKNKILKGQIKKAVGVDLPTAIDSAFSDDCRDVDSRALTKGNAIAAAMLDWMRQSDAEKKAKAARIEEAIVAGEAAVEALIAKVRPKATGSHQGTPLVAVLPEKKPNPAKDKGSLRRDRK